MGGKEGGERGRKGLEGWPSALMENLCSVSTTLSVSLQPPVTPATGESNASDLHRHPHIPNHTQGRTAGWRNGEKEGGQARTNCKINPFTKKKKRILIFHKKPII